MPDCRVFVDAPQDGAWNMAMDEVLLQRAAAETRCHLRIYAWKPATLSLGYFQHVADRLQHRASLVCPFVRRPSGGGAILHDREITYALAVADVRAGGATVLYRRIHAGLVKLLARLGAQATLCESSAQKGTIEEPFLCFQRRAIGDVLIGGHKVVGSAQRRARGAILQHGSILLEASPAAPELPGIAHLTSISLAPEEWSQQIGATLSVALDCTPMMQGPTALEMDETAELVRSKYGCQSWNSRR